MATSETGTVIKEGRRLRGWKLRDLSRRSEVSAATISRIENGEGVPSMDVLTKIAGAFYVDPKPLLILAGHVGPEAAVDELKALGSLFGNDLAEDASQRTREAVARRHALSDTPTSREINAVARRIFVDTVDQVAARRRELQVGALPDVDLLKQVLEGWRDLTGESRLRVADYVADQAIVSEHWRHLHASRS